jgi:hypothetical protein
MAERNGSARGEEPALTLGQLEGSYPAYCKALRILIREGKTLNQIKRTMCWHRLEMLHERMPRQYRDPLLHYGMTKRALDADQGLAKS